ncbi:LysR family transcriptional regulator [Tabrizicola sp. J26]|uniref:LysR family transcriptional regulator n=1 Tax=Alitabrizicola rongguiensis TaxID=2909234 RepID=UPI001F2EC768|nr:LysR family transcriptional regulator [Tabrizicola rongguiensis]MCF1708715.1 LysR family transcriptional regulator [Tabrizicola rongguiensis]
MIAPRRYLPSIPSLLALEALDRLGSASAAAEELSLTQSAISRQLQTLEGQMGVQLLLRDRKQLRLTPAARDYVRQVRAALEQIAQASLKLKANPTGGTLNLAILPAFGVHWLAPRLAEFARLHPEVTVNLSTRMKPFDFDAEGFDAAIHFGHADWPGAEHLLLMEEEVLPVCAPGFLKEPPKAPEDLLAYPLLLLESRPGAWHRWMAAEGVSATIPRGMVFDQFSTMSQAAIHGLGIGLLPTFLAEPELASGRLTIAWGARQRSSGSYWLVWPKNRPARPALASLTDWLAEQVKG